MSVLRIEVERIFPDAKMPERALGEAVGADVSAYLKSETGRPLKWMIPPNTTRLIPTGIIVRPPLGYFVGVCSRFSMTYKSVFVANAPGIFDPESRRELEVMLYNGGPVPYYVEHEHRIAQLILLPRVICPINEVKAVKHEAV